MSLSATPIHLASGPCRTPPDAGLNKGLGLFAAAPEHKRIAAFQPQHTFALARQLDQAKRDVNQSVTFLSGHDRTGLTPSAIDWDGLGRSAQVIVMYMAIKHMPDICARLIAAGRAADEPVAIVQNATRDDMKVLETTLGKAPADIAESGIGAPSIVCIGRVVLMRQCLDWMGQMVGEPVRDTDPLGVRSLSDTA